MINTKNRIINMSFAFGGYNWKIEETNPAAKWRFDPAKAGPSFALGDVGTHPLFIIEAMINIGKHGISFRSAERVFFDYDRIELFDEENGQELKKAREMPITFDEECPETTPERAIRFKRVNQSHSVSTSNPA